MSESAFPVIPPIDLSGIGSAGGYPFPDSGMTLRDYFAAKALPFCLREFGGNAEDQQQYAEAAYQIADSMLAERGKKS